MIKRLLGAGLTVSALAALTLVAPANSTPAAAATGKCSDYAPDQGAVLLCNLGLKPKSPASTPSQPTGTCNDYAPDQGSVFLCNLGLKPKPVLTPTPTPTPDPTPVEDPPPAPDPEPTTDNCGAPTLKADGTPWECTFSDDFNGATLDTSKWVTHDTKYTSFSMGNTCLRSENITVGEGKLKLKTEKVPGFLCGGARPYVTQYWGAGLTTWTNFSQTHGAFEAKVKYPNTKQAGLWGGFWMTPPGKNVYGGWPDSGEIDIAEWWSKAPDLALPTLHYRGKALWDDSGWGCTMDDPTAWHTHRLEWGPTEMKVYLDGNLCWTRDWDESSYDHEGAPFDKPFALNFSFAQDGSPAAGLPFPQTYEVDYVRAWK